MKIKNLLLISAFLYVGYIFTQFKLHSINSPNKNIDLTFVIDQIGSLFVFGIAAAGLGALSALIPYKRMEFREKFKITFYLVLILVLVLMVSTNGYVIFLKEVRGIELRPLK